MNKQIKDKWVAALRSGEYKQGIGSLYRCSTDKYCCLGVLCDLHAKENNNEWDDGTYLTFSSSLPCEVMGWAGLERTDPAVKDEYDGLTTLATLNDYDGCDFNQIADLIEKSL